MDNDGFQDILSVSGLVNRAYFLKNINAGEEFRINTYAIAPQLREIEAADLNNDGYADMILGSWPDESLNWAENYYFRIISQPRDTLSCAGGDAYFSVLAAGVMEYQWQMNDGTGWNNLGSSSVFQGVDKALLKINGVTAGLFGNQFRCVMKDDQDNVYYTDPAALNEIQASVSCIDNQVRIADETDTYTVVGGEFDPDTIVNPCNEALTLTNDYNNTGTLAGEIIPVGTYTITWTIENQENEMVDSCSFVVEILSSTGIDSRDKKSISVFPDPCSDFVVIEFPASSSRKDVFISDMKGKTILEKQITGSRMKVDLREFDRGIYLIGVRGERYVRYGKIIKM